MIGIHNWAWQKGDCYASIICDLERRVVIGLPPDREPAPVAAWLARTPTIEFLVRDHGGGYGAAAVKAMPTAIQAADRWHLVENAGRSPPRRRSSCRGRKARRKGGCASGRS